MLKNIKSFLIIKIIFSHIKVKQKLDLIKYNKKFQNKFSLNIIDYRALSEKYIKNNSYSIKEEYNSYNDELIFIGNYLNGKRNGFGKEFFDDVVIFEGYYLNGKRHGKGKEYKNDGTLIFEGEYLYGKKWNWNRNNGSKYQNGIYID